jgi:hypothetical protein
MDTSAAGGGRFVKEIGISDLKNPKYHQIKEFHKEIKEIDASVTQSRKFIFFRKEDLFAHINYWLLVRPQDMKNLYMLLLKIYKKSGGDPQKLQNLSDIEGTFPDVLASHVSEEENMTRIVVYSSLGFILESGTARPRLPDMKGLRYVMLSIYVRRYFFALNLAEKGPKIASMNIIVRLHNRVYMSAYAALSLLNPITWSFFEKAGDTPDSKRLVLPKDAPGWFAEALKAIEFGHYVPTAEQAVEVATSALTTKYEAQLAVYRRSLEERDAQLRRIEATMEDQVLKNEKLAKEVNDVKNVVTECNRSLARDIEIMGLSNMEMQEQRMLDSLERSRLYSSTPPPLPPRDSFIPTETIANATREIARSEKEVRDMENKVADVTMNASKALKMTNYALRSRSSAPETEKISHEKGRDALMKAIIEAGGKVPGEGNKKKRMVDTTSIKQTENKRDVEDALKAAVMARRPAMSASLSTASEIMSSSGWDYDDDNDDGQGSFAIASAGFPSTLSFRGNFTGKHNIDRDLLDLI